MKQESNVQLEKEDVISFLFTLGIILIIAVSAYIFH